jgi:hypothetical protein
LQKTGITILFPYINKEGGINMYIESLPCGCPATKLKKTNEFKVMSLFKEENSFLFMTGQEDESIVNFIFYDKKDKLCHWVCLADEDETAYIAQESTTSLANGVNTIVELVNSDFKISYGKGKISTH